MVLNNLIHQFYLNKFYAEMRNNENIRTNDSFKKGPFTYISTVLFQLFDDVWKPMAPIQNRRITVPVKVRVITEQVLREDIVGHHRKIKWPFLFPPFRRCSITKLRKILPVSLQLCEGKRLWIWLFMHNNIPIHQYELKCASKSFTWCGFSPLWTWRKFPRRHWNAGYIA